jgi:hypothetical protein
MGLGRPPTSSRIRRSKNATSRYFIALVLLASTGLLLLVAPYKVRPVLSPPTARQSILGSDEYLALTTHLLIQAACSLFAGFLTLDTASFIHRLLSGMAVTSLAPALCKLLLSRLSQSANTAAHFFNQRKRTVQHAAPTTTRHSQSSWLNSGYTPFISCSVVLALGFTMFAGLLVIAPHILVGHMPVLPATLLPTLLHTVVNYLPTTFGAFRLLPYSAALGFTMLAGLLVIAPHYHVRPMSVLPATPLHTLRRKFVDGIPTILSAFAPITPDSIATQQP